jgi:hypothetical protein
MSIYLFIYLTNNFFVRICTKLSNLQWFHNPKTLHDIISIYLYIFFPIQILGFTNPIPLTEISSSRFVRERTWKKLFVVYGLVSN